MLPHKKAKKRGKSKSPARPARPVTAGEGDVPADPLPPPPSSEEAAADYDGDAADAAAPKSPRSPKSPRTAKKKAKSKSRSRSRSRGRSGKDRAKQAKKAKEAEGVEPEPPWQPRPSADVPDYEAIHVTESLQPLRSDFFTVMEHLARDERLKNYTSEFVRMFEKVAGAHDHKLELAKKVEEQSLKMEEDASHIARLTEQLEKEGQEVSSLRGQIDELRAQLDASHLRELDSASMIENLREQMDRYQENMRHTTVAPAEENSAMADYERLKKRIIQEKQEMAENNQQLKKRLSDLFEEQEELQRKTSAANLQVTNLSEKLQLATQEVHRETRLKEKLEEELESLASRWDEKVAKEGDLTAALRAAERNVAALQQAATEQRAQHDRLAKDKDSLAAKLQEQRRLNDQLRDELNKIRTEYKHRSAEVLRQEEAIDKLHSEVNKAHLSVDTLFNQLGLQQQKARQVEEQKQELAMSVKAISRELDLTQREVEQDKREMASLQKTKDILMQKVVRGEDSFKTATEFMAISERQRVSLQDEITQYANEAVKQRRLIAKLEQERELLHADNAELNKNVKILRQQLNQGNIDVMHFQKELINAESKLQAQVNLTESTDVQRNKYRKLYEEARQNGEVLKSQSQILSASVEQLKETLAAHEVEGKRLSRALAKADGHTACLAREVNALQSRLREQDEKVARLEQAESALKRSVASLERERDGLQRDLHEVHNERDIIGTQLVRRNDELHLLLAKIDVLQNMLTSGEEAYLQRLDDIRLLKLEVRKLRQEKVVLQRDLVAGADLRKELYHLSKDLAFEKQRRSALEAELKTPVNLHRWRRLEATDPASLELIHKVNILQKRILNLQSQLLAKERQLQDAEKLYLNLRATMVKLPGPDVLMRLKKAQHALEHRANKIKSLFAELSMSEATVHDYRVDLNRVREELVDFKSMYYTAKQKLDSLGHPLTVGRSEKTLPQASRRNTEDSVSLPPIGRRPSRHS